jgi:threonine dehydratase
MWPLASAVLAGSVVCSLAEVARAIALLATRARVVAEGAGGTSLAAAMKPDAPPGKIVCVVSGGNIDAAKLAVILRGEVP